MTDGYTSSMPALSDEERSKLRLEELYRQEVRRELSDAADTGSRLWKALNSSFGLWLLSALFISGLGTLYTSCQTARERESAKTRDIERLDLEISYRFSNVLRHLNILRDRATRNPSWLTRAPEDITETLRLLKEPPRADFRSLYPQYNEYSLPALLADLRRNLENTPGGDFYDDDDRGTVDAVLGRIVGFAPEDGAKGLNPSTDREGLGPPLTDPFEVVGSAINRLLPIRWRRKSFFYVDCPSDRPFC